MTITEQRLNAIETSKITVKGSRENLIKCGILTKKGNISSEYKEIVAKKDNKNA